MRFTLRAIRVGQQSRQAHMGPYHHHMCTCGTPINIQFPNKCVRLDYWPYYYSLCVPV